jgi:tetratricopeptide (TPR) repeat protein
MTQDDPVNCDARPLLEYSCAIHRHQEQQQCQIFAMLSMNHAPITPYVTHFADAARDSAELDKRHEATVHIFRANVAELDGNPRIRGNELHAADLINPDDTHIRSRCAELARDIQDLRQGLQMSPGNRQLMERLADKLFVNASFSEAVNLYQELFQSGKVQTQSAYLHYAEALQHLENTGASEKILLDALARWPKLAAAHDQIAGVYLKTRQLDSAKHHMELATQLEKENPIFRQHLQAVNSRIRSTSEAGK